MTFSTASPGRWCCSWSSGTQNTFTGRVTPGMMDAIFTRARGAAGLS